MGLVGHDLLGLGHKLFPYKHCIKIIPEGTAIGAFVDDTFGTAWPQIKKMAASGKFPAFRLQAHWDNNHVIVPVPKLTNIARKAERLAILFPHITWYLSHSTEHNGNLEEVKKRMSLIETVAPHTIPVNNPWNGATIKGYINEKHHSHSWDYSTKYMHSWDGANCYDGNVDKWHKDHAGAEIRFLWGLRYNLREVTKEGQSYPPPKERKAIPSKEYIKALVRLQKGPGLPPQAFPRAIPVKSPLLYKTFSEDHPHKEDPWENMPVLIIPENSSKVDVIDCKKKVVTQLGNGGDYPGGMWRYYSGINGGFLWGYQIAAKALKQSGSEFVWFKVNGKIYGPVNPAFRQGTFIY